MRFYLLKHLQHNIFSVKNLVQISIPAFRYYLALRNFAPRQERPARTLPVWRSCVATTWSWRQVYDPSSSNWGRGQASTWTVTEAKAPSCFATMALKGQAYLCHVWLLLVGSNSLLVSWYVISRIVYLLAIWSFQFVWSVFLSFVFKFCVVILFILVWKS